jgi:metal-responsive CopG/Arc/MetJ family transcriptional regulator
LQEQTPIYMKRISIDFDDKLMDKLITIQGQKIIDTKKKVSLSKIVTDLLEEKLLETKKATS